jgi:hypothetical protein
MTSQEAVFNAKATHLGRRLAKSSPRVRAAAARMVLAAQRANGEELDARMLEVARTGGVVVDDDPSDDAENPST